MIQGYTELASYDLYLYTSTGSITFLSRPVMMNISTLDIEFNSTVLAHIVQNLSLGSVHESEKELAELPPYKLIQLLFDTCDLSFDSFALFKSSDRPKVFQFLSHLESTISGAASIYDVTTTLSLFMTNFAVKSNVGGFPLPEFKS